ncbi:MAG: YtxH domain-containing protein [Cyanobacteria bacterium P01_H01_bin.121]
MSRKQRNGSTLGSLLTGVAVGAAAGLLLAPRSGKETRRLLRQSTEVLPDVVDDLAVSLQLQADRLSETALSRWQGTLVRLKEALVAGIEASQQEFRHEREVTETSVKPREVGQVVESYPVHDRDR